ncbi:hypothetical protein PROFUN_15134 [Planoprotostelium fungivorum]|uniref:Dienelactone hydrolase domain-containing protein n=1 Tax=Planoprotostelium fungivorum TaxID=1890364 RepID=A0A2P6MXN3_9EUKA|nr:hypothetical protein PROFUN_15134 [Planoprotostelium fungivorum]
MLKIHQTRHALKHLKTHRQLRKMTSSACCNIPPVTTHDYQPKGKYEQLGSYKTYVTGDKTSGRALLCAYDIFGFFPQTIQGADILASQGFYVTMPDFFHGKPYPLDQAPPKNDEQKQNYKDFFATTANVEENVKQAAKLGEELKKQGLNKIGIYGYCWGGKIAVLSAGQGSPFHAAAQIHPAMVDANDGKKVTIPVASFISKDEPEEAVQEFHKNVASNSDIASKSVWKRYPTVHHGWAAARGKLDDAENKKQYEDVYRQLSSFFKANL